MDTQYNAAGDIKFGAEQGDIYVIQGDYVEGKTGQRLPLHLPVRAENFKDREEELAALLAELQPGRVVTLAGPGGMGKTALAAEAVGQLVVDNQPPERFPDGVFFHSFYNQPQVAEALESLAIAFGEEPHPTPQAAAQRALSGRQALLVLDGTEDADNLSAVLGIRGQCGALVTSRKKGDAPDVLQNLNPLEQIDAVEVLQAWAGTQIDDQDAAKAICALVGRLPLAVRLVGRYLRETQETASEYLGWLQETPLEALDQGQRREDSVPVLLERSLGQVSEEARQVLAVAGLLALAPFQREVIVAALAAEESQVRRWIGELVTYGLLNRAEGVYGINHALIHAYVRQQLRVADAVASRLVDSYDGIVRHFRDQGLAGYAVLDRERVHVMRLIEGSAERGDWSSVRKLVWALEDYLDIQGHTNARQRALTLGITAAQAQDNRYDEGAFLGTLGLAYRGLGEVSKAIEYHEQALAIAKEIGHRQNEGIWLGNLGLAYRDLGEVSKAIEYYEQALKISREIGYRQGEGNHLGNLGTAYSDLGEVSKAIEYYEQGLLISREIGHRQGEGNRLGNLGLAYRDLGEVSKAIEYHEQALKISREIGHRQGEGADLGNLGIAYSALGEVSKAIEYYEQALKISREIGHRQGEGNHLGNLGLAYRALGEVPKAIEYYEQALKISREIGYRQGEGNHLGNLGIAYSDLGEVSKARKYLEQAVAIFEEIKSPNADFFRKRLDDLPPSV